MRYTSNSKNRNSFLLRLCTRRMLIIIFLFQLSTTVSAQITLNIQKEKLAEVFKEIRRQSGYDFFYNDELLSNYYVENLVTRNESIDKVLDKCLSGTRLSYTIKSKVVVIKQEKSNVVKGKDTNEHSQNIIQPSDLKQKNIIRGKVTDKQGKPIIGAIIRTDSSSSQFQTDKSGDFTIPTFKEKGFVMFSFLGYKAKQVHYEANKTLHIVMDEDVAEMEEVVVNGLFTQNKNSYTGAVTTLKGEDLVALSPTNLLKAISILTPGFRMVEDNQMGSNPNHIPEIIIRGMSSIASQGEYGMNTPLIIIDGVEVSLTQLYDLDMFEIDRVDILKDASATSMYGERAANGVIVIERKKVDDKNVRLRYNLVPSFEFPDISSYNYTNAAQKLELERIAGLYNTIDGSLDESYNAKFKRIQKGVDTDWIAKPLRNAASFNHSLNMTGRGGGMDYGVTASFSDKRGVMKGDYRGNYGLSFYFSYRLVNKFTVTYRADVNQTNSVLSPYGSFADFVIINPYDTPFNEFGEWNKLLSYDFRNPLYDANTSSFDKSKSKSIGNNLSLRWDILKGFYTTGAFSYNLSDSKSDRFLSPEHSTFDKETDPTKRGTYNISSMDGYSWQARLGLTYNKQFTQKGTVLTFNLGTNANRNNSNSNYFSGLGFLKGNLTDMAFANSYPTNGRPGGSESISSAVGVYSNLNFILSNKYFVDGSYRVSGSSKFGKERRFAPFWSLGLGWNAHNESFIKAMDIFDIFRFRGSFGYTGSVNFSDYQAITTYRYQPDNSYLIGMGALPIAMGNDRLKWQTTIKTNVGTTIEMFKGRLSANFDIYKENTKDLLLAISTPPSVGVKNVMDNLGETENWGYEWSISGMLIKKDDFYWRSGFSGHHTENKLVKISNALKRQNDANLSETGVTAPKLQLEQGESATAIYAVPSLGIDPATGREIFIKKDGSYTFDFDVKDKVSLGNTVPYFQGAMTTALGYKRFSLTAALSFTFGGDIYNSTRSSKVERINPRQNVDVRAFTERWKKPGDIVHYTALTDVRSYVHSQRFIERKNELYLSSLNLTYEVNPALIKGIGLKKLRVGIGFSEVMRLSTVVYERGTSYPYSKGYNFIFSPTF